MPNSAGAASQRDNPSEASPSDLARQAEDQYLGIRNRLEVELIDKLAARATWAFGILGTVAAGLGFFGAKFSIQQAVTTEVKEEIRREEVSIDRFRTLVTESLKEAATLGAKASATLTQVEEASEKAQKTLDTARAAMEAANQRAIEYTQRWTIALSEPFDRQTGVLRDTTAQTQGPASSTLTTADKSAIVVRQTPRDTGETTPDGRRIVEITFSIDVDPGGDHKLKSQIMPHIEKIEYGFDERWFSPATRPVNTAINDFSYSVRVWGITRVRAALYLKEPPELLLFGGSMSLSGPGTLNSMEK